MIRCKDTIIILTPQENKEKMKYDVISAPTKAGPLSLLPIDLGPYRDGASSLLPISLSPYRDGASSL